MLKNKIRKIDLAKNLSVEIGFSSKYSQKLLDDLIYIIKEKIKKKKVNIKNIGTFKLLNKKERTGRNPKTGKTFLIKSRKVISFIPSKNLNTYLND